MTDRKGRKAGEWSRLEKERVTGRGKDRDDQKEGGAMTGENVAITGGTEPSIYR